MAVSYVTTYKNDFYWREIDENNPGEKDDEKEEKELNKLDYDLWIKPEKSFEKEKQDEKKEPKFKTTGCLTEESPSDFEIVKEEPVEKPVPKPRKKATLVSTYQNDYTFHDKNGQIRKLDDLTKVKEHDNHEPIAQGPAYISEQDLLDIKKMYRNRNWSTYQKDYDSQAVKNVMEQYRKQISQPEHDKEELKKFENTLYNYCEKLFMPYTKQILPPIKTSRRILGCLIRSKMYTPLTTYQKDYGEIAYEILKKRHDLDEQKNIEKENSSQKEKEKKK